MTRGREEREKEADRTTKGVKGIRFLLTELRTSAASMPTLGVSQPRLHAPPALSDKLTPPLDAAASSLSVLPRTEMRARSVIRVLLGKQPGVCGQKVQWEL